MRIKALICAALATAVMLATAACSSSEDLMKELGVEQPATSAPAATTSPTTEPSTTPTTPQPTPSIAPGSIAHVDALAGGEYFQSERRQAPLQEALVTLGTQWRDMMLSGEIPAVITGWDTYSSTPVDGYGSVASIPYTNELEKGQTFIRVDVKITNGQVDTSEEPIGLHIITADGQSLELAGRDPLIDTAPDGSGIRSPGSPRAYDWTWLNADGSYRQHMFLIYADDSMSVVPPDRPIDPSREYKVHGEGGSKTPGMINEEDATFISYLYSLDVSGSNWNQ